MSVPDYYVLAGFLGARILDEFYYQPKGIERIVSVSRRLELPCLS